MIGFQIGPAENYLPGLLEVEPVYVTANDITETSTILQSMHYGRPLRPGEVGCTRAHFVCWEQMVNCSVPSALVVEGDFAPTPTFSPRGLLLELSAMESDTPIIALVGISRLHPRDYWWVKVKHHSTAQNRLEGFAKRPTLTKCGTVAYMINFAAAKLLAKKCPRDMMADDFDLYRSLGIEVLFRHELQFCESPKDSTTGNPWLYGNRLFSKRFLRELSELAYYRFFRSKRVDV
jgi:glycosyl transferase family 25